MSVEQIDKLEEKADAGSLSRSELDELVQCLDASHQDIRDTAAEAIKTYSKENPDSAASVVKDLRDRVTESEQSSTRQANLGEALSQIALEHPDQVEPVAETLFSFTTNPWKYFSFTDGVAAIAAESAETRQMLRDKIENESKAKRNNALYTLAKVGEKHPDKIEPFVPLFVSILEEKSRYLKERGQAATCFARANPDHEGIDSTVIETLLHSEEKVAIEGALDLLNWTLANSPSRLDPTAFQDRLDELKDHETSDVSLWLEERKKAETLYEALSDLDTARPDSGGGSSTKVYTAGTDSSSNSSTTPPDSVSGNNDTGTKFCPSCGTDLREWDDVSFCVECGTNLSS